MNAIDDLCVFDGLQSDRDYGVKATLVYTAPQQRQLCRVPLRVTAEAIGSRDVKLLLAEQGSETRVAKVFMWAPWTHYWHDGTQPAPEYGKLNAGYTVDSAAKAVVRPAGAGGNGEWCHVTCARRTHDGGVLMELQPDQPSEHGHALQLLVTAAQATVAQWAAETASMRGAERAVWGK